MGKRIEFLAFDADDTLWHNETFFQLTQQRMEEMLAPYADAANLRMRLLSAEQENITHYGYGVKGFTLSMIETAIEVTEARVPSDVIAKIIDAGRELLSHPVELLPGVEDTLRQLAPDHHIALITKGDLLHQEQKLAQSGLGELFDQVEIVSDKTPAIYEGIFGGTTEAAMMVGNSIKSDVLPAIETGAHGVHVPFAIEWELEKAAPPDNSHTRFHQIETLADLPDLLRSL